MLASISIWLGLIFIGILAYCLLILYVDVVWQNLPDVKLEEGEEHLKSFSIIIPARNEAEGLAKCLESILQQDYPKEKYEIIVVDDHSDDLTFSIASDFDKVKVISLDQNSGKKEAIAQGINLAQFDHIVCVDADCTFGLNWLRYISCGLDSDTLFLTAPIIVESHSSLLSNFQSLDTMASMATTAVGIKNDLFYLANGANMSFSKRIFQKVDGYAGNENVSSGDDVFLVSKIAKIGPVRFIKNYEASAITEPEMTFQKLIAQRIRWSTKTKSYASRMLFLFQIIVFGGNIAFLMALIGGVLGQSHLFIACLFKAIVDFVFLFNLAKYFGQKSALKSFAPLLLLYPIYYLFMAFVAIFPIFTYWKGRKVKT